MISLMPELPGWKPVWLRILASWMAAALAATALLGSLACGSGEPEVPVVDDPGKKTGDVATEVDYPFGRPEAKRMPPNIAKKIENAPKETAGPDK
jgi:hypothetical protein